MTKEEIVSNGNKAFIREVSDGGKANIFVVGQMACAYEYEKRIEDLEQKLEQAEKDLADYQFNYPTIKEVQKENTELEKELVELKKRNGVLAGQKASLGRWLGEAVAVIKKFSEFLNDKVEYDPEHSQEHTTLWNELCERAERFLKEFIPPEV